MVPGFLLIFSKPLTYIPKTSLTTELV